MKLALLILPLLFFACETKLSDEQRKALRDEMADRKIKKIGQEEIYKEALAQGRKLVDILKAEINLDSIEEKYSCTIKMAKSTSGLSAKEKEVFEAYKYAPNSTDNIQKEQQEYLIYTKPNVVADTLESLLFIRFEKKEIVKKL